MLMARNEVYNCDCLEYMRSLPDGYFDVAVCDPPFGSANDNTLQGGANASTREDASRGTTGWNRLKGGRRERYYSPMEQVSGRLMVNEVQNQYGGGKMEAPTWDIAPTQEFFDELFRVSKNQIIWGGNYFSLPPTRCFLVWKKHIPEKFSMAMCEYAWTSFCGNAKVFECPSLRNEHSGKFHPTEKPQALYGWIYKNYVSEGQTVFDPMMGSQASRIAAYKMGIDYVGCEIDKYYFNKGEEFFKRECLGEIKTAQGRTIIQKSLF